MAQAKVMDLTYLTKAHWLFNVKAHHERGVLDAQKITPSHDKLAAPSENGGHLRLTEKEFVKMPLPGALTSVARGVRLELGHAGGKRAVNRGGRVVSLWLRNVEEGRVEEYPRRLCRGRANGRTLLESLQPPASSSSRPCLVFLWLQDDGVIYLHPAVISQPRAPRPCVMLGHMRSYSIAADMC
eukprot:607155-Hanusia_phi.AAC.11